MLYNEASHGDQSALVVVMLIDDDKSCLFGVKRKAAGESDERRFYNVSPKTTNYCQKTKPLSFLVLRRLNFEHL